MTPLAGVFLGALVTLATVALAWQWRHRATEFGTTPEQEAQLHAAVTVKCKTRDCEERLTLRAFLQDDGLCVHHHWEREQERTARPWGGGAA